MVSKAPTLGWLVSVAVFLVAAPAWAAARQDEDAWRPAELSRERVLDIITSHPDVGGQWPQSDEGELEEEGGLGGLLTSLAMPPEGAALLWMGLIVTVLVAGNGRRPERRRTRRRTAASSGWRA